MSHGAAAPAYRPTAWAYLPSGTARFAGSAATTWPIFEGKQLETYPDEPLKVEVFNTIPVLPKGWTDMAHVRRTGENWVKTKRKRCQKCGCVFVSTPRFHDGTVSPATIMGPP